MVPIYVIGSSNTDLVVKSEQLPRPRETVLGGVFFMNAGGKGANQAVAAARMAGNVTLVAHLGKDLFGQEAIKHFQKEKINTTYITSDDSQPSGVALILVDSKGENSISVAPGSNGNLDVAKVEAALAAVEPPAIVLLQMEIPLATVQAAISLARKKNLTVILNPAPAQRLDPALVHQLDYITPNEVEAGVLTGISVMNLPSAEKAALALLKQGVKNVVMTLGANGAFILNDKVRLHVPVPVVTALDTTGAGDCFNGALAVGIAEGKSLKEAVTTAAHAASISVTRLGAQDSMPYRAEVQKSLLQ